MSGRLAGIARADQRNDTVRFLVVELRRFAVGPEHHEPGQRRLSSSARRCDGAPFSSSSPSAVNGVTIGV